MTTHVFIVDDITFPLHLQHLFAGTGAKDTVIDFNDNPTSSLPGTTENMLAAMIADASRIRKGDYVIFYLQQNLKHKIFEGKFYGIFKATRDWSFLDNNDTSQYLRNQLGKSLTFRTLIEPHMVYAEGVTEWEALDEIKNIHSPNQMLWSLIYRKLKGNRGNTMITIYESERLCQLIRDKNAKTLLQTDGNELSFDANTERIVSVDGAPPSYGGRQEELNILPRAIRKFHSKKAFEAHLQAYIVKNIGQQVNKKLDETIVGGSAIEWIGNEVYCGVGMRKIDVMLSIDEKNQRCVIPIELKVRPAIDADVNQVQRYIDWIQQYYTPNRPSDIQPILVAKIQANRNSSKYERLVQAFERFNEFNSAHCKNLKYIEFAVEENDFIFEPISYES